ncbi:peptidyl-prolyl cis-trans isomerase SurA [Candidatus Thioglobus sp.]|nr:peptidyl-prolyl cis-trans isomerase SurA [Candidatus Thioglobus sp.]
MKNFLVLLLLFFTRVVFSENTIVALVNNAPITLQTIQNKLLNSDTNEEKKEILNSQIDITLQLQKVSELNIAPTIKDVEAVLIDIAKSNNLSINELLEFDEINSIIKEIQDKLSVLNLQRFITKDMEIPAEKILIECSSRDFQKNTKQIKIAQIFISEIDSSIKETQQQKILIKAFLNKLSSHISKGASFEAFAKLHSQHPSYKDGGVTDWLTINNPTLEMLDNLNENEVSEIYSTVFGLAIAIKIDEQFISSKLKECEEQVIYQNAEEYYANWLKNLREESFIEIYYDKLN